MVFNVFRIVFLILTVILLPATLGPDVSKAQEQKWGKSHHGSHYDEGPRSKPWLMEGIGNTAFPITTKDPEVQRWFNQGNTLLHGFWYFEAERAFRWCIKLDPDCAMAYWGLARCNENDSRERSFFKEAIARKSNVSKRERDYLEVWEAKYAIKGNEEAKNKAVEKYMKLFDNLLINYPDDIEARALYWHEVPRVLSRSNGGSQERMRFALDSVLQDVLRKDPDHVGALHYRVHNWDGEEGHFALNSCLHLSEVAPNCGHLQHMPGHVLSSIGLWNEAAIAMDAATRVEKEYMRRRMVLPEDNWDYIHNLDYLAYIQEQLGLYEAALISCQQLLKGPDFTESLPIGNLANFSMVRLLVKYEKWDEILNQDQTLFRWKKGALVDPALRAYARTHALIGLNRLEEAEQELAFLQSHINKIKSPLMLAGTISKWFANNKKGPSKDKPASMGKFFDAIINVRLFELKGKLALAKGESEKGIELLEKAAELQFDNWHNDPPMDAVFIYNTLGEAYFAAAEYEKAVEAFEKTLEKVINDGFALSGLVVACDKLDRNEDAQKYLGRLSAVWSDADPTNRWLDQALATGVKSDMIPNDLMNERNYRQTVLNKLGHSIWTAPDAPDLLATASNGDQISLKEFRGKNVLLIFYLGGQCLHCMDQINEAYRLSDDFKNMNTEIIAISKDDLETIRKYEQSKFGITLLSDPGFSNARRFNSYDDFEEIELHSTILIDASGRVHWSRHGGDPFMDFEFLMNEIQVLNGREEMTSK